MKIVHAGIAANPYCVDGVCRTAWLLSGEQAKLGYDVSILLDRQPDDVMHKIASETGLKLLPVQSNLLSYRRNVRALLERQRPDIVHMHSVFIVRQALLGQVLREMGIPYIATPHGGLAPGILKRGRLKKSIYSLFGERPRLRGAQVLALVTPGEDRVVKSFVKDCHNPMVWMPNPVETHALDGHPWRGPGGASGQPKRLVYLGRYDVMAKGIDILIEIGRHLPEFKLDLYGTEDRRTRGWLHELQKNLPPNVTFHKPIFGPDKARILASASIYLQAARWEGFPVSVAEALYMGVPTVITDVLDMAPLYKQHDLGLLIPLDPKRAAELIRSAASDEPRLADWSRRGREYALQYFHPTSVAKNHIKLYQHVTAGRTSEIDRIASVGISLDSGLETAAASAPAR